MNKPKPYALFSLVVSAFLFALFAYTGYVLQHEFVPKDRSTETVRMMARADHIYLFYAACLNLVLGLWGLSQSKTKPASHLLQWSSCTLLAASGLFPAISFFTQTMGTLEERTLMLPGLYLLIASMLCLILAVYKERNYISAKT